MFELKCLTCIHGEVCAYKHGGVDLSIISGDCKYYKPTADVVPKSEVEKAKQEVAREIFKEIEKIIHGYRIDKLLAELGVHIVKNGELTLEQQLAELKKKYT